MTASIVAVVLGVSTALVVWYIAQRANYRATPTAVIACIAILVSALVSAWLWLGIDRLSPLMIGFSTTVFVIVFLRSRERGVNGETRRASQS